MYVLFLDARKAFDRVCYSELPLLMLNHNLYVVCIARQKSMSPNCTIAMLYVSQLGLLCKVEQQEFI